MSYTPTEWESTDVVTATRMNALEQAVGDMNMSYTPNTWSDGDILSAEKMNALEQAVASGGGGSSDFSTATMTISGFPSGIGGGVSIGEFAEIEDDMLIPVGDASNFQNGTYVVVLYQGTAYVTCFDSITVSGDAEYDGEGMITATGDFTISPLS